MLITIAVDNTITSYTETIQKYLQTQPTEPNETFAQKIAHAYAQGILRDLKPAPGVAETLWNLNENNHQIKLIVDRFILHGQNHKVVAHTTEWLDTHDIPYREILFLAAPPTTLKTDIYIDADPRTLQKIQTNGTIIKYNQPENEHIVSAVNVNSWKEIEIYIANKQ